MDWVKVYTFFYLLLFVAATILEGERKLSTNMLSAMMIFPLIGRIFEVW